MATIIDIMDRLTAIQKEKREMEADLGSVEYIYESPDKGVRIYRRPFGMPDQRQLIKDKSGWLIPEREIPCDRDEED